MKRWCLSKYKPSLMLLIFMVQQIQCICIENEKNALLDIKASLIHELSYRFEVNNPLSTWVENGSECCDWERIKCNTTTGHITGLSMNNIFSLEYYDRFSYSSMQVRWPLNFFPFLRFKELTSLDLSWNFIDDTIVTTGLEGLSNLNKLEILNLSSNHIETNILPSIYALTSLKILDLSYINGYQYSLAYGPGHGPIYDISEFSTLKDLEVLDLTGCGYYGTLQMQGSTDRVSILTKLKTLNLMDNYFNGSLVTSLSAHHSLETLDLSWNYLPAPIEGCKVLMGLERLESISLAWNNLNKSIISCLSFLPSLKILDLSYSNDLGGSFPMEGLSSFKELNRLDLSFCSIESLILNGKVSIMCF